MSRSSEVGGWREIGVFPNGMCVMNMSDSTNR